MAINSPEKGLVTHRSVETSKLIVRQPTRLAELNKILDTFDNLNARVGEKTSEDASSDWSGSGTASSSGQGDDGVSPRDQAINAIPSPLLVRQRLEQHIEQEVKKLEREARRMSRSAKPGAAFHLNELYSRIRKLNSLLGRILEAAEDVLRRLFIRVFIDRQPIL